MKYVGDKFTVNGHRLLTIAQTGCKNCYFFEPDGSLCNSNNSDFICSSGERVDQISIKFILIENDFKYGK
jgi:hypothetical protein